MSDHKINVMSSAPDNRPLGIEDNSGRIVPLSRPEIPVHCPILFIYAEKGPEEARLYVPNDIPRVYGERTLDVTDKYYNHQTAYLQGIASQGNACVIKRLIPNDMGLPSRIRLCADVSSETVDLYERNSSGAIIKDPLGTPKVKTPKGRNVTKIVWRTIPVTENSITKEDLFGTSTPGTGLMTNSSGEQSTLYPILELELADRGESGNNYGIRFNKVSSSDDNLNTKFMKKYNTLLYKFGLVKRHTKNHTAKAISTTLNERMYDVAFNDNMNDPETNANLSISKLIMDNYTDGRGEQSPFSRVKVYEDSLGYLLSNLHNSEKEHLNVTKIKDFTTEADTKGMINIATGTGLNGNEYESIVVSNEGDKAVSLNENSYIWASGGNDGDMSEANTNVLVSEYVRTYGEVNGLREDIVLNPETFIYDSGFSLDTKKVLGNFISKRKNTILALSTSVYGDSKTLPISTMLARAAVITSSLGFFVESAYFGTSVCRAIIVGSTGTIPRHTYKKRIPMTFDVAVKAAKMMGASNGTFDLESIFTTGSGSIINNLEDLSVMPIGKNTNRTIWMNQVNYPRPLRNNVWHLPAIQTVYVNENSVLNDLMTVVYHAEANTVVDRVHRNNIGNSTSNQAELSEQYDSEILAALQHRFGNGVTFDVTTSASSLDEARGYSLTTVVAISTNLAHTVLVSYTSANRAPQN